MYVWVCVCLPVCHILCVSVCVFHSVCMCVCQCVSLYMSICIGAYDVCKSGWMCISLISVFACMCVYVRMCLLTCSSSKDA